MPLLKKWQTSQHSLAAIWHIEEQESFFNESTGLFAEGIHAEKRRLEHLAGRFLLRHLKEDFPLLEIANDEHDKPRLPHNRYRFSISHSYPYVAAVVSDRQECGLDIQCYRKDMQRLAHKYLSLREQEYFGDNYKLLCLAWSAKEAAYKWQGRRGVEFIEHMPITSFLRKNEVAELTIRLPLSPEEPEIQICGFMEEKFSFAVVVE